MPGKVFVNYRRDDARDMAARVRDRLAQTFGDANVFMDVDNLIAGQRFDRQLEKALAQTDVFLAVIGPRWLELLAKRQASGERDYVLEEISGALKRGVVVIPVLVERTPLPRGDALPEGIREIVLHQTHDVVHARFGRDVTELVEAIQSARNPGRTRAGGQPKPRTMNWLSIAIAIGVLSIGIGAMTYLGMFAQRYSSGQTFRDCPECPEMVVVPAGSFLMGSPEGEESRQSYEGPQHRVTIGRSFAVGQFAVTFDEWDACVAAGGCNRYRPGDEGWGRGRRPVINVSWQDAKAYAAWLSTTTGKSYRLLSEAEREYVARAGTSTPYWYGPSISIEWANFDANFPTAFKLDYVSQGRTVPVDSFAANPWGLYQVHGNVSEWVEDCYNDDYNGAPTDGSAWTTGTCFQRMLRGGSWASPRQGLRSAVRGGTTMVERQKWYGFRVGRTL